MNLLMQAEIFSVAGLGKLRISYNWHYSALNCDPNDNSAFIWNFYDAGNGHVAISPKSGYGNMTLYASVRDDWDYYVQVQAPHSADWITAAQRDEIIGLQVLDLSLAKLSGFNGQLIGVDNDPSSGNIRTNGNDTGSHKGHRIRSIYSGSSKQTLWFLKTVSNDLGSGVATRIGMAVEPASFSSEMQKALQQQGVSLAANELSKLLQQINA